MMYQGSILVLLQMVKKEATDIPVAEQGEAEWRLLAFSSLSPKLKVVNFNLIKFKAGSTESSMHSNINIDSFA